MNAASATPRVAHRRIGPPATIDTPESRPACAACLCVTARRQATVAAGRQRKGLLAKIHVAKVQMGLSDDEYQMILQSFKMTSAADMSVRQLENMVTLMKNYGWKPQKSAQAKGRADHLDALRRRCVEIAKGMKNGERRLAGLAAKICGVSTIAWCKDANKLERLLAVLASIKEKEQ